MRFTVIAETGARFGNFAPYVASIDDQGRVAYYADLVAGGCGLFIDAEPVAIAGATVSSHPDINSRGDVCFYTEQRLLLLRDSVLTTLVDSDDVCESIGPLGPTMNQRGAVAFRAQLRGGGEGVFMADERGVTRVADTKDRFDRFHGLPVITNAGTVAFRADQTQCQGIYTHEAGRVDCRVQSGDIYVDLARFVSMNDAGTVAFVAKLTAGGSGVHTIGANGDDCVVHSSAGFTSFRGALINNAGEIVFYATPDGGELGVYDSHGRIIGIGDKFHGSEVTALALNPVSMNDAGQLAIRLQLANDTQLIVRVD